VPGAAQHIPVVAGAHGRRGVAGGFDHEEAVALTNEGVESAARQLREATVHEELKSLALGMKLQLQEGKGQAMGGWLSSNAKPEKTSDSTSPCNTFSATWFRSGQPRLIQSPIGLYWPGRDESRTFCFLLLKNTRTGLDTPRSPCVLPLLWFGAGRIALPTVELVADALDASPDAMTPVPWRPPPGGEERGRSPRERERWRPPPGAFERGRSPRERERWRPPPGAEERGRPASVLPPPPPRAPSGARELMRSDVHPLCRGGDRGRPLPPVPYRPPGGEEYARPASDRSATILPPASMVNTRAPWSIRSLKR
jgi:hypothetical protein